MKEFLKQVLHSKDNYSSRRFITLIVCAHFVLASFMVLFLFMYMLFYKETVSNLSVFDTMTHVLITILEYDFYIILGGLGFVTVSHFSTAIIERAKSAATGQIYKQPSPTIIAENVENVSGPINGNTPADAQADVIDDMLGDPAGPLPPDSGVDTYRPKNQL